MSLLGGAGFDIEPWKRGAKGKSFKRPASNPKFCYEWVHVDGQNVALNLWYQDIKMRDGTPTAHWNPRKLESAYKNNPATRPGKLATVVMRAERTHEALLTAYTQGIPIRAIISDGVRRSPEDPPEKKSKVKARSLDEMPWIVQSYDNATGEFSLRRGVSTAFKPRIPEPHETYLVLAENEVNATDTHDWADVTGVRYHFPNNYRNIVIPGARFIYYRGRRRKSGERATPEYFGAGTIGDVVIDDQTAHLSPSRRKWIAEIADYTPFETVVPFRDEFGHYSELLSEQPAKNRWGVGVRKISLAAFQSLRQRGGLAKELFTAPQVESGKPTEGALTEIWRRKSKSASTARQAFDYKRLSKRAKVIGDEAERIALHWLQEREPDAKKRKLIRWVAQQGETPGYDIADARGLNLVGYEVKGTTAKQFLSLDLTWNELECAKTMAQSYVLVLVSGVFSKTPVVTLLPNPAQLVDQKALILTPTAFRVELAPE